VSAQRIIRPDTAFSLDTPGRRQKRPRQHKESHLAWIRTLPCVVTGARAEIEAAHIRYADARYAKRGVGTGEKPDDKWTVPLRRYKHREQHAMDEREFWAAHKIDPVAIASALWGCSGDDEAGEQVIREFRKLAVTS
jgi:hypothetical protein